MNKVKITKREIVIFSIVSIIFLLIPFIAAPNFSSDQSIFKTGFFKRMLFENILLLVFFLVNYFVLIPKLYFQKRYFFYIVILIIFFFVVYKVPEFAFHFNKVPPKAPPFNRFEPRKPPRDFMMWSPKIIMFLMMAIVSLFIRQNKRFQEMKNEKQLSEIAYLRAQINPHFLFNTLNNIYALTLQKSDSASDAVMKLSKMMRFVVSDSSKDFVPLQQDLDYIKNYIELQKLRLTHKESVIFEVEGNPADLRISPLILINFIENAFKYGVIDEASQPVIISIKVEQQTLFLNVENTISKEVNPETEKSEIGLKNTKKRLDFFYTNHYKLTINDDLSKFIVELKIFLND
ncbi:MULTISPECIES: sensor histidine kinase [unclassified Empedobacter]|uniref:sensor histidine kinase n=1 Tax=unclassified Empedobacter TaxID=2643773 RepID=UPI0025C73881|nr:MULTISPECIES: sensor histidine kinase [unclassified Empedobacter]